MWHAGSKLILRERNSYAALLQLTFGFGFPVTLHVKVTGIPSKILKCFSFISKNGATPLSTDVSPQGTSSADSSTGDLSSLYSISLMSLCSQLETLYS